MLIESLENRRLLSAVLANGVLTIDGTKNADVIDVSSGSSGIVVSVNSAAPTGSPFAGVTSIVVNGGAGNDSITIESSVPKTTHVRVNGNGGADVIVANGGHGGLFGDDGNDKVTANSVQYLLGGGTGADTLSATGGANDIFHGAAGADQINVSGGGFNVIVGGRGGNTINVAGGNDTVISGAQGDKVTADAGATALLFDLSGGDSVTGHTDGSAGVDTIYSGSRNTDTINAGANDLVDPNGKTHPPHATKLLAYIGSLTDPSQLPPVI